MICIVIDITAACVMVNMMMMMDGVVHSMPMTVTMPMAMIMAIELIAHFMTSRRSMRHVHIVAVEREIRIAYC